LQAYGDFVKESSKDWEFEDWEGVLEVTSLNDIYLELANKN